MENLGIECKKNMVREIKQKLESSENVLVGSFNSIAVAEQEQLRRQLKEVDARLLVVKNRMAQQVFKQLDLEGLTPLMRGLTALSDA